MKCITFIVPLKQGRQAFLHPRAKFPEKYVFYDPEVNNNNNFKNGLSNNESKLFKFCF